MKRYLDAKTGEILLEVDCKTRNVLYIASDWSLSKIRYNLSIGYIIVVYK